MDKNAWLGSFCVKVLPATISGLLVMFASSVAADPGTLSLGLDTEYTDNARLSASNEEDDFKNTASLSIDKRDQFGRLDSYLVGELEYYTYANDTFANNLDSNLLWDATYNIRPGTLTWGISDALSEVTIDSSEPDTPDNRTTRNIFSTGPSYTMNLSKVDYADFTAEYQRVDYKTEGDDNDRFRFLTSLTHLLSPRQQVSANYDWTKTLFGSERELYRNQISASYRYSYSNFYFDGSYGLTHLKGRVGTTTEETDSNTWNVTLKADTSRTSNIGLTYNRELNDSASGFDQRYEDTIINITDTSVILLTEWSLFYTKSFANNSAFDGKIYHNISEYLIENRDEERNGIDLGYRYPVFHRLTLEFSAGYSQVDYTPSARADEQYDISVSTSYEYIRNLFFTAELARTAQDSNSATNEYEENRASIGLRYIPSF